jgi:hypothetical protein
MKVKTLNYTDMIKVIKKQIIRIAYSTAVLLTGIVSFGIIVQSCSQNDDSLGIQISENEKTLNLTAPNGEKIAENILQLKEIVSVSVGERFGTDKEFYITSLEYIPVREGYAVLVKYRTSDNMEGGLVRVNSRSVYLETDTGILIRENIRLKSSPENTAIFEGNTVTCFPEPYDSNCTCIPTFTRRGDGVWAMTCSNSPSTCTCKMQIAQ